MRCSDCSAESVVPWRTWQPGPKRWALYLPFMHSDDLQVWDVADEDLCVTGWNSYAGV